MDACGRHSLGHVGLLRQSHVVYHRIVDVLKYPPESFSWIVVSPSLNGNIKEEPAHALDLSHLNLATVGCP